MNTSDYEYQVLIVVVRVRILCDMYTNEVLTPVRTYSWLTGVLHTCILLFSLEYLPGGHLLCSRTILFVLYLYDIYTVRSI